MSTSSITYVRIQQKRCPLDNHGKLDEGKCAQCTAAAGYPIQWLTRTGAGQRLIFCAVLDDEGLVAAHQLIHDNFFRDHHEGDQQALEEMRAAALASYVPGTEEVATE